ncbi:ribosomal-protein-alanine N-acetyltransferase [Flavobacterium sp. 103]|uniref:GNAT family N-acetyltransferase n=1 Tax=Flavobacterium sp. 103 TaxID=2135624 RepID=UPI000D5F2610|nr:GNAT family N-acetyltransferase [Flavobacterium sp. 103]PVX45822.1 ribosomal-protein-alanine N-acetyltransferase [Flavobacterium sp. 103]
MIITENVIIDKLKPIDASQLHVFMIQNTERFTKFFPRTLSDNVTLEKSLVYIETKDREIQQKINFTFAIREIDTQKIIGLIIIKKIDWTNRIGELAYCIENNFEGKGLISKVVKVISSFAYNELELKTLQIIAHKTNFGSIKVAENNGFIWQRTLIDEFTPTNELPLNMELYELTNER